MGGTKKKSLASMEKQQDSTSAQQEATPQKGKKGKEAKASPQQQQRKLPFLVPKLTEAEMVKALTPLKAITVFTASRTLGVNASIATTILRGLESKEIIKRQGGFSGHAVWSVG